MLILSRKVGEIVRIGDNITIRILGHNGSQIRIGFEAPENTSIHREEIYEKIQVEKRHGIVYQSKKGLKS